VLVVLLLLFPLHFCQNCSPQMGHSQSAEAQGEQTNAASGANGPNGANGAPQLEPHHSDNKRHQARRPIQHNERQTFRSNAKLSPARTGGRLEPRQSSTLASSSDGEQEEEQEEEQAGVSEDKEQPGGRKQRPRDAYLDEANCARLMRRLSVISNRNFQLLAGLKLEGPPVAGCEECTAWARRRAPNVATSWGQGRAAEEQAAEEEQQQQQRQLRRRSSLINMILGAPNAGPRFSDDLCSLDSRLSGLCDFGIEFFPDPPIATSSAQHQLQPSAAPMQPPLRPCIDRKEPRASRASHKGASLRQAELRAEQAAGSRPNCSTISQAQAEPEARPSRSSSSLSSAGKKQFVNKKPENPRMNDGQACHGGPPSPPLPMGNGTDHSAASASLAPGGPRAATRLPLGQCQSRSPVGESSGGAISSGARELQANNLTTPLGYSLQSPATGGGGADKLEPNGGESGSTGAGPAKSGTGPHHCERQAPFSTAFGKAHSLAHHTETGSGNKQLHHSATSPAPNPFRASTPENPLGNSLQIDTDSCSTNSDAILYNGPTEELCKAAAAGPPSTSAHYSLTCPDKGGPGTEAAQAPLGPANGSTQASCTSFSSSKRHTLDDAAANASIQDRHSSLSPVDECSQRPEALRHSLTISRGSVGKFAPIEPMMSIDLTSSFDNYHEDHHHLSHVCPKSCSKQHTSLRGKSPSSPIGAPKVEANLDRFGRHSSNKSHTLAQGGGLLDRLLMGRLGRKNEQLNEHHHAGQARRCASELSLYSSCCRGSCYSTLSGSSSESLASCSISKAKLCHTKAAAQSHKFGPCPMCCHKQTDSIKPQAAALFGQTADAGSLFASSPNLTSNANLEGKCEKDGTAPPTMMLLRQTKLIILLQVCLPFILAGFGNLSAGLVFNRMAQWSAFQEVPTLLVLLPSFMGLKGNIEMTLASRLSTLSNLNLLNTNYQRRNAYLSNLVLMFSHAIGLSFCATMASVVCQLLLSNLGFSAAHPVALGLLTHRHNGNQSSLNQSTGSLSEVQQNANGLHITNLMEQSRSHVEHGSLFILRNATLVVLPCALLTSIILIFISSIIVWWTVWLAAKIRVNPDNLSTLVSALYGDLSCVMTYGLFAQLIHTSMAAEAQMWPIAIIVVSILLWLFVTYEAYMFEETHDLVLSSVTPTVASIGVSLGSGMILSIVLGKFHKIALYQPVVNGFGANLIAAQASRVSTYLWCSVIRRVSKSRGSRKRNIEKLGLITDPMGLVDDGTSNLLNNKQKFNSLSSFLSQAWPFITKEKHHHNQSRSWPFVDGAKKVAEIGLKLIRLLLWSFCNPSPNSTAARLLLITIVPAHTLYFFVIWLLSPTNSVVITWQFYLVYMALCLVQVFSLLLICEPLMKFLMKHHMDPDVFGISLLMSLADLMGTLCLTAGFQFLALIGDINASEHTR